MYKGLLAEIQVSSDPTTRFTAANCNLKCFNYRVYQLWRAHKLVYYKHGEELKDFKHLEGTADQF